MYHMVLYFITIDDLIKNNLFVLDFYETKLNISKEIIKPDFIDKNIYKGLPLSINLFVLQINKLKSLQTAGRMDPYFTYRLANGNHEITKVNDSQVSTDTDKIGYWDSTEVIPIQIPEDIKTKFINGEPVDIEIIVKEKKGIMGAMLEKSIFGYITVFFFINSYIYKNYIN